MTVSWRRWLAAGLTGVAALMAACGGGGGDSSAVPDERKGWTGPTVIKGAGFPVRGAEVWHDGNTPYVGWVEHDTSTNEFFVHAVRGDGAGGWTAAWPVYAYSVYAYLLPQLAIQPDSRAVVAASSVSSNKPQASGSIDVSLMMREPSGTWSTTTFESLGIATMQLAAGPTGDFVFAWSRKDAVGDQTYRIWITRWDPLAKTWSNPVPVSAPGASTTERIRLLPMASGAWGLAWLGDDVVAGHKRVQWSRMPAAGAWSAPQWLSANDAEAGFVNGLAAAGDAHVSWSEGRSTPTVAGLVTSLHSVRCAAATGVCSAVMNHPASPYGGSNLLDLGSGSVLQTWVDDGGNSTGIATLKASVFAPQSATWTAPAAIPFVGEARYTAPHAVARQANGDLLLAMAGMVGDLLLPHWTRFDGQAWSVPKGIEITSPDQYLPMASGVRSDGAMTLVWGSSTKFPGVDGAFISPDVLRVSRFVP